MINYKGKRIWRMLLWGVMVWKVEGKRGSHLTLDDAKLAVDRLVAPVVSDAELRQHLGSQSWEGEQA